jgi:putative transposase
MEIYKRYKFRLYPTKKQQEFFNKTIGCGRFLYNWALALRKEAYEKNGIFLTIKKDIQPLIPLLKEEHQFLKEADSIGLVSELRNLEDAFNRFFQKKSRFPKFKHRETNGCYITQLTEDSIHIQEGYVNIPKCGRVKCVFHRNIKGFVKKRPYVAITYNNIGEFFVSILALCSVQDEPTTKATEANTIGVDMGLKDLAILDDGTKYDKIAVDDRLERRRILLQRKLEKKVGSKKGQKKSNNYIKLQQKLAKIDKKVARRREHYQYNVVSDIVSKHCDYIGIEDLNAKGMSATGRSKNKLTAEEYALLSQCEKIKYNRKKKRGYNKSVRNASLFLLKTRLENKARQNGKKIVKVGKFYASSQTCSDCGAKNKLVKNLKVRKWVCPQCGAIHDRDVNAAKNIRNEAIRIINEKCETTHKNLTRCNREVKSAENHRKEKTVTVGVSQRFIEPEIQVINGSAIEVEVVTTC